MSPLTTRRFLQLATLAAAGWLLGACGRNETPTAASAPAPAPASATAPAPAARPVTVGTDAAYAPFESQNEKGEIVGFDIELAQAVAQRAGLTLKFVNTPWEGIFNALAQGDRDMVISAVTITEERRQTMDFSAPYFDARQLIAVRNDSKVAKFADLKKLKVGVQTGTTGDEAVTKLLGKTSDNIKRYESTPLALKELESGGLDAVVADNGVVIHFLANNPGGRFRTVADPDFVPEQYGMAVRKGNAELLARLNEGLTAFKADGGYAALYTRYFGSAPAALPAPAPANMTLAPASAPLK